MMSEHSSKTPRHLISDFTANVKTRSGSPLKRNIPTSATMKTPHDNNMEEVRRSPRKHGSLSSVNTNGQGRSTAAVYPGSSVKSQSRRSFRTPVQTLPLTADSDKVASVASKSFVVPPLQWEIDTPRSNIEGLLALAESQPRATPQVRTSPRKTTAVQRVDKPFKSPQTSKRARRSQNATGLPNDVTTPGSRFTPRTNIWNLLHFVDGEENTPAERTVDQSGLNVTTSKPHPIRRGRLGQEVTLSPMYMSHSHVSIDREESPLTNKKANRIRPVFHFPASATGGEKSAEISYKERSARDSAPGDVDGESDRAADTLIADRDTNEVESNSRMYGAAGKENLIVDGDTNKVESNSRMYDAAGKGDLIADRDTNEVESNSRMYGAAGKENLIADGDTNEVESNSRMYGAAGKENLIAGEDTNEVESNSRMYDAAGKENVVRKMSVVSSQVRQEVVATDMEVADGMVDYRAQTFVEHDITSTEIIQQDVNREELSVNMSLRRRKSSISVVEYEENEDHLVAEKTLREENTEMGTDGVAENNLNESIVIENQASRAQRQEVLATVSTPSMSNMRTKDNVNVMTTPAKDVYDMSDDTSPEDIRHGTINSRNASTKGGMQSALSSSRINRSRKRGASKAKNDSNISLTDSAIKRSRLSYNEWKAQQKDSNSIIGSAYKSYQQEPRSSTPTERSKRILHSTKVNSSVPNLSMETSMTEQMPDISPIGPSRKQQTIDERLDVVDGNLSQDEAGPESSRKSQTGRESIRELLSDPESTRKSQSGPESSRKLQRANNKAVTDLQTPNNGLPTGYSPLDTPYITMNKRNEHTTGEQQRQGVNKSKVASRQSLGGAQKQKTSTNQAPKTQTKRVRKTSSSILPKRSVKFFAERHSKMKLSWDAIDEIEAASEVFWADTFKALEAYALHAGRKIINEQDAVLLMKTQRLVSGTADLHDRIRELLPMELRTELIPGTKATK